MSSECESVSMIGTSFLLFHEDEKSSKCEQEPKDNWNRLKKKNYHLMRMRRVPSVSKNLRMIGTF